MSQSLSLMSHLWQATGSHSLKRQQAGQGGGRQEGEGNDSSWCDSLALACSLYVVNRGRRRKDRKEGTSQLWKNLCNTPAEEEEGPGSLCIVPVATAYALCVVTSVDSSIILLPCLSPSPVEPHVCRQPMTRPCPAVLPPVPM